MNDYDAGHRPAHDMAPLIFEVTDCVQAPEQRVPGETYWLATVHAHQAGHDPVSYPHVIVIESGDGMVRLAGIEYEDGVDLYLADAAARRQAALLAMLAAEQAAQDARLGAAAAVFAGNAYAVQARLLRAYLRARGGLCRDLGVGYRDAQGVYQRERVPADGVDDAAAANSTVTTDTTDTTEGVQ